MYGIFKEKENNCMRNVKVKLTHLDAQIPCYKYSTDSGMDIRSIEEKLIPPNHTVRVETGVAFSIPKGYELQIRPRSGLAGKGIIAAFGTIDNGYTDSIKVIITNIGFDSFNINKGDRIAQVILSPIVQAKLIQVDKLPKTERGISGHGSSGLK